MEFLRKLAARSSAQTEQPEASAQESNNNEKSHDNTNTTAAPELTYELKIAQENKSHKKAKLPTVKKSERSDQKTALKSKKNEVEPDANSEGEEFDLRQAIIYSEIMKPKYSNEEI